MCVAGAQRLAVPADGVPLLLRLLSARWNLPGVLGGGGVAEKTEPALTLVEALVL